MPVRKPSALVIPHIPVTNGRLIILGIGGAFLDLRWGLGDLDIRRFMKRQMASHPPSHILLPYGLPLLPAGEVALFTGHDLPRVDDVEKHESAEHEGGVEDVLVCFVDWDAAAVAFGVLDYAVYDADLGQGKLYICWNWVWKSTLTVMSVRTA